MPRFNWQLTFTLFLVLGATLGQNPAGSACGLFVLSAYYLADKYFHDSFHDENRKAIALLKTEMAAVKSKQSTMDLKSALGGKNG